MEPLSDAAQGAGFPDKNGLGGMSRDARYNYRKVVPRLPPLG
jgi:hypothetical protein